MAVGSISREESFYSAHRGLERERSPARVTHHSLRQLTVSAGTERGSLWVSIQHVSLGTAWRRLGEGRRYWKRDPQSGFFLSFKKKMQTEKSLEDQTMIKELYKSQKREYALWFVDEWFGYFTESTAALDRYSFIYTPFTASNTSDREQDFWNICTKKNQQVLKPKQQSRSISTLIQMFIFRFEPLWLKGTSMSVYMCLGVVKSCSVWSLLCLQRQLHDIR